MSVPYLTATRNLVTVNQDLQLGSSNVMLDRYGNQMWVPGSTVQWQPTPGPPVVTPPTTGFSTTTSYAGGTYRWVGNEIVYNVNTQTQVLAVDAADRTGNYTLSVPYPIATSAYGNSNVVVGDLWMYVMTAGTVLTFKAYARTQGSDANAVALRYLSGSTDDTLAAIDAGSTFVLQGSLTYVTTSVNGGAGLMPPRVVPAGFSQNQLGQVLLNGSGASFQPRGQLDVATACNVPALVVDQRSGGTADVMDLMIGGVKSVVVDSVGRVGIGSATPAATLDVNGNQTITGNIGIGTTNPQAKLDVVGSQIVSGNVGIGTTNPQAKLDVVGNQIITGNHTVTGNVGIGTTNPQTALDVNGNAFISGYLRATMPMCCVYLVNNKTDDVTSIVVWTGIHYNPGGHYKPTGADAGKFVCPVTGAYLCSMYLLAQGSTAIHAHFAVDGVAKFPGSWSQAGDYSTAASTQIFYCTAGQKIEVRSASAEGGYSGMTILYVGV